MRPRAPGRLWWTPALAGLALGMAVLALAVRSEFATLGAFGASVAACTGLGLSLALRPRGPAPSPAGPPARGLLPCASATVLMLLSVALLASGNQPYERSPVYYGAFAAAAALAFVHAVVVAGRRGSGWLVALHGVALVATMAVVETRLFPYLWGADTHFHSHGMATVAATGSTAALSAPYSSFPGLHVLGSIWEGLAGDEMAGVLVTDAVVALILLAGIGATAVALGIRAPGACALLAFAAPGFLYGVLSPGPVRLGAVGLVFLPAAMALGGRTAAFGGFLLVAGAGLYHPVLAAVAGATALAVVSVRSASRRPGLPARRWGRRRVAFGAALVAATVLALLATALVTNPSISYSLTQAVRTNGSQVGALGVSHLESGLGALSAVMVLGASLGDALVLGLSVGGAVLLMRRHQASAWIGALAAPGLALAAIVLIFASQRFLFGPERFLTIAIIAGLPLAGAAVAHALVLPRRPVGKAVFLLGALVVFGAGVTSYRTDGNGLFSDPVPVQTDHATDSLLTAGRFLGRTLSAADELYMDPHSRYFIAHFPDRAIVTVFWQPTPSNQIHNFEGAPRPGVVVLTPPAVVRAHLPLEAWVDSLEGVDAALVYSAGPTRVYTVPPLPAQ